MQRNMLEFRLSQIKFELLDYLREFVNFLNYLAWLIFDPLKFKTVRSSSVKNLLVVFGGATGDCYNVIGAMNSVKIIYPNIKLYALTNEKNRNFIKNPEIEVIDLKKSKNLLLHKRIDSIILYGVSRNIEVFDSEMSRAMYSAKNIVAFDLMKLSLKKWLRQKFFLSTRKLYPIRCNGPQTIIDSFRKLGLKISEPSFYFTKEGENWAKKFVSANNLKKKKIVLVHPNSAKTPKAIKEGKLPAVFWPIENWTSLINGLTSEGFKVILTGVSSEKVITDKIYDRSDKTKIVDAVGKTPSIEALASLIKKSSIVISMDTSTAHISAQVGVPQAIIFGSTLPNRTTPISKKKAEIYNKKMFHHCRRYACKHCHNVSLKSISTDFAFRKINSLIKQPN